MSGSQAEALIRRWIFPMVRAGEELVLPFGEGPLDQLRQDGGYDADFPAFLQRFLKSLADPAWVAGSYFPAGWYRALRAAGKDPLRTEPDPQSLKPFYADELCVDRQGRWRLGAKPVTGRVLRFFLGNLFYDAPLALYCVRYRVEQLFERCYLHHESPPFRIVAIDLGSSTPQIVLNDGTREPFEPDSLWLDAAEELHCPVKSQRLPGRFATAPRWEILKTLEERQGRMIVRIGGKTVALAGQPAAEFKGPAGT